MRVTVPGPGAARNARLPTAEARRPSGAKGRPPSREGASTVVVDAPVRESGPVQTWPAFSSAVQQVSTIRRVTTYGSTLAFGRRSSM
ncbi:hypothetical protein GCM10022384_41430 [Streptomyces marokkonensis]|uniref:Uncharacterized protein n=1 Tax=Streptomyces marokkonensis TaxID=324855 RepID=A0ABP7QXK0_9ACTN